MPYRSYTSANTVVGTTSPGPGTESDRRPPGARDPAATRAGPPTRSSAKSSEWTAVHDVNRRRPANGMREKSASMKSTSGVCRSGNPGACRVPRRGRSLVRSLPVAPAPRSVPVPVPTSRTASPAPRAALRTTSAAIGAKGPAPWWRRNRPRWLEKLGRATGAPNVMPGVATSAPCVHRLDDLLERRRRSRPGRGRPAGPEGRPGHHADRSSVKQRSANAASSRPVASVTRGKQ